MGFNVTRPGLSVWEGVGMAPKNVYKINRVLSNFNDLLTWKCWGVDLFCVRFLSTKSSKKFMFFHFFLWKSDQKSHFPQKLYPLGFPHVPAYFSLHPDSLPQLPDSTRRKKFLWFFLIWHISKKLMIFHGFWMILSVWRATGFSML